MLHSVCLFGVFCFCHVRPMPVARYFGLWLICLFHEPKPEDRPITTHERDPVWVSVCVCVSCSWCAYILVICCWKQSCFIPSNIALALCCISLIARRLFNCLSFRLSLLFSIHIIWGPINVSISWNRYTHTYTNTRTRFMYFSYYYLHLSLASTLVTYTCCMRHNLIYNRIGFASATAIALIDQLNSCLPFEL